MKTYIFLGAVIVSLIFFAFHQMEQQIIINLV